MTGLRVVLRLCFVVGIILIWISLLGDVDPGRGYGMLVGTLLGAWVLEPLTDQ